MSRNGFDLAAAAYQEMLKDGFHPDFPDGTTAQIESIRRGLPSSINSETRTDLRHLLWSSIDNDTSRDLDQVEWTEKRDDGSIRVLVGVADVAASVAGGTPIDQHAAEQTKTVYTGVRNFPMLPNELSTDLTSLNETEDRAAIVTEYVIDPQGCMGEQKIYRALLRNQAKLAYSRVGPWLEGASCDGHPGCLDFKIAGSPELQSQLRAQDEGAQRLRAERERKGAINFRRVEADPLVVDGQVKGLEQAPHNRASQLIEEFMIGANETMAITLRSASRSCIRRAVRVPERWDRIVELAQRHGGSLPNEPDSGALNTFLQQQRQKDPVHYPDLSLSVIKLLGPGEYVLVKADDPYPPGHFGLAARDYAHSTAPNRRYADLIVQRLLQAMLDNRPAPYTDQELSAIAMQCNIQEQASHKVERAMIKRVAAVALSDQIGRHFQGVITGASEKGVYVRVFDPPVEGRIIRGEQGLDVGDKVEVRLIHTNPQLAFIDFARV